MAFNAMHSGVMPFWINAGYAFALTCRVGKARMAAQTKRTVAVDHQFFGVFGMVEDRPVAVLAWNDAVQVFGRILTSFR